MTQHYKGGTAASYSTIRRRKREIYEATPDHCCPNCNTAHPKARNSHYLVALPIHNNEPLWIGCLSCVSLEKARRSADLSLMGAEHADKLTINIDAVDAEIAKLQELKRLQQEIAEVAGVVEIAEDALSFSTRCRRRKEQFQTNPHCPACNKLLQCENELSLPEAEERVLCRACVMQRNIDYDAKISTLNKWQDKAALWKNEAGYDAYVSAQGDTQ